MKKIKLNIKENSILLPSDIILPKDEDIYLIIPEKVDESLQKELYQEFKSEDQVLAEEDLQGYLKGLRSEDETW